LFRCAGHRDHANSSHAERLREEGGGAVLHEQNVLFEFAALDQSEDGFSGPAGI
jgi:hypothetical protein